MFCLFVFMFLRCCWSDLFQRIPKLLCLELSLSFSLVVSCGGPSASGQLGFLVCFLSFKLNRSWFSVGLGSIIGFFGILAFLSFNSVGDLACFFVGPSVLAVVGCPVSCVSVLCVLVLSMQFPKVRNGASLGTRIGGACNHEFLATHVWPPKVGF